MAEDRPLFDDEWLPDWLIKAGISFRGPAPEQDQASIGGLTPANPSANVVVPSIPLEVASELANSGTVPTWMQQGPTQNQEIAATVPDWMQRGSPTAPDPSTSALPSWMRHDAEETSTSTAAPDLDALPLPDLETFSASDSPDTAPTQIPTAAAANIDEETLNALPWTPGVSNPLDQPLPIAVTDASWLSETPLPDTTETPASAEIPVPSSSDSGSDLVPDWFAGLGEREQNARPDWFNPVDSAASGSDLHKQIGEATNPPGNEPVISTPAGSDIGSPIDSAALDWMSDLPDLPGFSTVESPSELASQAAPPPTESTSIPIGAADDIPAWMHALGPDESIASPPGESVPDWLADLPRVADQPSDKSPQPDTESADWLVGLQPATASKPVAQPGPETATRDTPSQLDLDKSVSSADIDALMSLPYASQGGTEPAAALAAPLDTSSLSLEESDLDNILGPMPAVAAPEVPAPTETTPKIPPSKKTGLFRVAEARAANTPTEVPEPEVAEVQPATALPEFVTDLRPSDVPVQFKIGGAVEIGVEESPLAQLPDQLRQLRDHALAFKPPEPPPTLSAGPLADLAGPLAAEPVIVRAATSASPSAISVVSAANEPQLRRVELIRRMLEIEGAASQTIGTAKPGSKARPAVRVNVERLVVTLILLAFIIAPFFTHALNVVSSPDTSVPTAAQSAVFNAMDSLTAGQTVLVAFEYGPTGAGELDDLARVLLRDLFKHQVKPVVVSTDFAGAMHAESFLLTFGHDTGELRALNRAPDKPLLARTDYVVLPYLPSGAAGVRTLLNAIYRGGFETQTEFTRDLEGQLSGLNLATDVPALRNAPVIVLAETADDVRNWAEQYRAPADVSAVPARIVLATSAAANATARTYSIALPQTILGPLVGVRDATLYEILRQPNATSTATDRVLQRWQSIGLGALIAAFLLLFGAVVGLLGSFRRREARH